MHRSPMVCVAAAAAFLSAASAANAQSFYFGVGPGYGGGGYYGPHRDYYLRAPRVYVEPQYPPYAYRSYSDCYWVTKRRYSEYNGGWVVRRVRVCD